MSQWCNDLDPSCPHVINHSFISRSHHLNPKILRPNSFLAPTLCPVHCCCTSGLIHFKTVHLSSRCWLRAGQQKLHLHLPRGRCVRWPLEMMPALLARFILQEFQVPNDRQDWCVRFGVMHLSEFLFVSGRRGVRMDCCVKGRACCKCAQYPRKCGCACATIRTPILILQNWKTAVFSNWPFFKKVFLVF